MRWRPISLASMLLLAGCEAEPSKLLVLTPSRAADTHEAIWLKVTVGPLPRGSRLNVTDEDGKLVGTISPFGAGVGQTSVDYTLPLPKSDASGGPVRLRMEMATPGAAARQPTPSEVLGVQLVYVPVSD